MLSLMKKKQCRKKNAKKGGIGRKRSLENSHQLVIEAVDGLVISKPKGFLTCLICFLKTLVLNWVSSEFLKITGTSQPNLNKNKNKIIHNSSKCWNFVICEICWASLIIPFNTSTTKRDSFIQFTLYYRINLEVTDERPHAIYCSAGWTDILLKQRVLF